MGDKEEKAFQFLKEKLMSTPILQYPDFSLPFILYTDASGSGLGAVLAQKKDKKDHVIAYASRSMSKTERNYSITDQECLAVVWAIQHFHHYLVSQPFTVVTDHIALKWLQTCKMPDSGRRARWIMNLQSYKFDIQHRPGKSNANADALSRMYEEENEEQEVHCLFASVEDKKGKKRADHIDVNVSQLEKFYARKFEDTHLDQQHDSWERPFKQQDWEPEDEQKYTFEQESWGELREENRNEMWENDSNDWGNSYPNEPQQSTSQQQQYFGPSRITYENEFIKVAPRGDDSYAYGFAYNTANLQQLYSQNIAIRQVIANQPYTRGNGQCDDSCDIENHHIHTYCRGCKRNIPYGTTIHQCNIPNYNCNFAMDPNFLVNQPWWNESIRTTETQEESFEQIRERFNRELEQVYQTPGIRKIHIDINYVVDEQQ